VAIMHTLVFNSGSSFLKFLLSKLDARVPLVYARGAGWRGLSDEIACEPVYAGRHHAVRIVQLMRDRLIE